MYVQNTSKMPQAITLVNETTGKKDTLTLNPGRHYLNPQYTITASDMVAYKAFLVELDDRGLPVTAPVQDKVVVAQEAPKAEIKQAVKVEVQAGKNEAKGQVKTDTSGSTQENESGSKGSDKK